MTEITANVNWLAVIVGAVVAFLLGWLWFSPKLFGTKWAEGARVNMDEHAMPGPALGIQALGNLLLSWTIGVAAAADHLMFAILIVLTIVCLLAANGLFAQKNRYAVTVEAGFIVSMAIIMIVAQAVF